MSEINNESMEKMVTYELEPETVDTEMDNCNKSGVVKVIGAALAVGAGAIAAGAVAIRKKLKAKKESDKPKTKKKLMWVEVPVEDVVEQFHRDVGVSLAARAAWPGRDVCQRADSVFSSYLFKFIAVRRRRLLRRVRSRGPRVGQAHRARPWPRI